MLARLRAFLGRLWGWLRGQVIGVVRSTSMVWERADGFGRSMFVGSAALSAYLLAANFRLYTQLGVAAVTLGLSALHLAVVALGPVLVLLSGFALMIGTIR